MLPDEKIQKNILIMDLMGKRQGCFTDNTSCVPLVWSLDPVIQKERFQQTFLFDQRYV